MDHLAQSTNGNTDTTTFATVTTANSGQDGGAAKVTQYAIQKKQEAAMMKRKFTDALKLNSVPKKTLKEMNGSEDTSVSSKNTVKEGSVSTSKNAAKEAINVSPLISTTTTTMTTTTTPTPTPTTATGKIAKQKQIVAKQKQIRVQKFAQIYEPDTDDDSSNNVAPPPPLPVVANNKLPRKGTQKIPIESSVHDVAIDENLHDDDDEDDNRNNLDVEEQELHNEFDQYIAHVDDDNVNNLNDNNDNSNEVNVVANITNNNIIRHPNARPKNMKNYMTDAISWIERPLDKYKSYSLLTRAFGYEYNSSNSFLRHGGIFDLLRVESTFFNFWEHGLNIFIGTNMGAHSIYPLYFTRRVCNDHEFVCKPLSNCKIEETGAAGSSMTFFVAGVFRAVKTTFPSFFVELSNCCRIEMATKNVANTLSIKNTCTPCTHYLTACKHTDCGVGVSITPFDGMDCLYNICSRINNSFQAPLREDYNGKFCYVRGKGLAGKYHTASNTIYITTWDITDLYIFN